MCMEDMREQYRKLEDVAEMAENPQEKSMIMRVAQKSKENYTALKQLVEKPVSMIDVSLRLMILKLMNTYIQSMMLIK